MVQHKNGEMESGKDRRGHFASGRHFLAIFSGKEGLVLVDVRGGREKVLLLFLRSKAVNTEVYTLSAQTVSEEQSVVLSFKLASS